MRVTCERCLRRYDVPDETVKGRKIRARCKCGARVVVQDAERAARSASGQTTGSIQRPPRWFVDITSWEPIAMDLRQLTRAFDAGRIDADTLVWRKGMRDWRRLRDVSELADRLMKDVASRAPLEAEVGSTPPAAESEPRRSERSRTPRANFSVSPGTARGLAGSDSIASGSTELMPGHPQERPSSEPNEAHRDSANAGPRPAAIAPYARTITQTGLAAPLPTGDRASTVPQASATPSETGRSEITRSEITRSEITRSEITRSEIAEAAKAPSSSRESRSMTPRGGYRRPNSDETPAQNPSSLSVRPEPAQRAATRRRRPLAAAGALALGAAVFAQLWLSGERSETVLSSATPAIQPPPSSEQASPPRAPEPELAPPSPNAEGESTAGEERGAHALEAKLAPVRAPALEQPPATPGLRASQQSKLEAPTEKSVPQVRRPAPSAPASSPRMMSTPAPPSAASGAGRAAPGSDDASRSAEATAKLPVASSPKAPAPARPTGAESASPAAGPRPAASAAAPAPPSPTPVAEAPSAPPASDAPSESTEAPAAPRASASSPGASSPSAAAPAPASEAAPFDLETARTQTARAAARAAACGERGPTRGHGQVSVRIETWGRVVRVTHLNQAFVGTPVGVCVMEAFQGIRVPPFDGESQTLTSSFVIQ